MKTLIKILISLTLIYTPFFAFASAAEKWTIEEVVYNNVGKTLSYTAEKNYGPSANDNKYKVKIPVTASVAGSTALSMIRGGIAGAAILGLVEGVGWIIENGIVYKREVSEDPSPTMPNNKYVYEVSIGTVTQYFLYEISAQNAVYKLADALYPSPYKRISDFDGFFCPNPYAAHNTQTCSTGSRSIPYGTGGWDTYKYVGYSTVPNPNYNPSAPVPTEPKKTPVSPSEIGEEIIDSPAAPQILPDIYNPNNPVSRPSPAPDLADKALENAPPIPKQNPKGDTEQKPNEDTDGDGEPDVFNPEKPSVGTEFTLPEFCSWAVTVCEWYTKYKEDSDLTKEHREAEKQVWSQEEIARQEEKQQREDEKSFWQKVEDWFDWSKEDSDLPENEQSEIIDLPVPDLKEDAIKWNSQCPADVQIPINLQGVSSTITFSWSPWCQLLDVIKPAIIASAYIGAAFIVLGLRT
jgi:hypothetical protein